MVIGRDIRLAIADGVVYSDKFSVYGECTPIGGGTKPATTTAVGLSFGRNWIV